MSDPAHDLAVKADLDKCYANKSRDDFTDDECKHLKRKCEQKTDYIRTV